MRSILIYSTSWHQIMNKHKWLGFVHLRPDICTFASGSDFQDYVYTAGVKDDGQGESLGEFSQFAIKIVMQGTNAAQPPRIRDLRIIALAT